MMTKNQSFIWVELMTGTVGPNLIGDWYRRKNRMQRWAKLTFGITLSDREAVKLSNGFPVPVTSGKKDAHK